MGGLPAEEDRPFTKHKLLCADTEKELTFLEPIFIHTDALGAIQTLMRENDDNQVLLDEICVLSGRLFERSRCVTLHWIPSHVGIEQNDRVDESAKSVSNRDAV